MKLYHRRSPFSSCILNAFSNKNRSRLVTLVGKNRNPPHRSRPVSKPTWAASSKILSSQPKTLADLNDKLRLTSQSPLLDRCFCFLINECNHCNPASSRVDWSASAWPSMCESIEYQCRGWGWGWHGKLTHGSGGSNEDLAFFWRWDWSRSSKMNRLSILFERECLLHLAMFCVSVWKLRLVLGLCSARTQ